MNWHRRALALVVAGLVSLGSATFFVLRAAPFTADVELQSRERYHHRLRFLRLKRPQSAQIHYQQANLMRAEGMLDDAIAAYRRCLERDKTHPQARWFLALTLADKGYRDQAFTMVRELIEEYPDDPALYERAALLLDALGQPSAARDYYDRWADLVDHADPDHPGRVMPRPGAGG